jgi:hypothetical protein
MLSAIKKLIKETDLYLRYRKFTLSRPGQIEKWEKSGRPVPPPHMVKRHVLKEYADKYRLKILVETGTYYGDMVEALLGDFEKIYSIELSEYLYTRAKQRFSDADNVVLVQGDSSKELKKILNDLKTPALFWLDGHYSGGVTARGEKDCPIYEELEQIFNSGIKGHVIIVDDALLFGSDPSYPTLGDLKKYVLSFGFDFDFYVKDDSIRITPNLLS